MKLTARNIDLTTAGCPQTARWPEVGGSRGLVASAFEAIALGACGENICVGRCCAGVPGTQTFWAFREGQIILSSLRPRGRPSIGGLGSPLFEG